MAEIYNCQIFLYMHERARISVKDTLFSRANDLSRAAGGLASMAGVKILSSELPRYLASTKPDLPPPPPPSEIGFMVVTLLATGIPAYLVTRWLVKTQMRIYSEARKARMQADRGEDEKVLRKRQIEAARQKERSSRLLNLQSSMPVESVTLDTNRIGGFFNEEEDVFHPTVHQQIPIQEQPEVQEEENHCDQNAPIEITDIANPEVPQWIVSPIKNSGKNTPTTADNYNEPPALDFAQIYTEADPDNSDDSRGQDALDALQVPKAYFAHLPVAISEMNVTELDLMTEIEFLTAHPEAFTAPDMVAATTKILSTLLTDYSHRIDLFRNSDEIKTELKFWLKMMER